MGLYGIMPIDKWSLGGAAQFSDAQPHNLQLLFGAHERITLKVGHTLFPIPDYNGRPVTMTEGGGVFHLGNVKNWNFGGYAGLSYSFSNYHSYFYKSGPVIHRPLGLYFILFLEWNLAVITVFDWKPPFILNRALPIFSLSHIIPEWLPRVSNLAVLLSPPSAPLQTQNPNLNLNHKAPKPSLQHLRFNLKLEFP